VNLLDDIPEGALVALDTVIWIYAVEANPVFGPIVRPFFDDRLATGQNRAGSSLLALAELLVQPLSLGRADLAASYRSFFTPTSSFAVWEITRDVIETAADLRARHRLQMMDALHVASAIVNRADLFLSNDDGLLRVTEVKVVVLTPYLPPAPP
jgi:predicted nucleic acid-binding protein